MLTPDIAPSDRPSLGRAHARRLREIYRSAGWPCQDVLEIELLAAGMLDRVRSASGHESLRVSETGLQLLAATLASNRSALSAHEALVEKVAQEMGRAGRIAWRGLSLRARVPCDDAERPLRWCIARPDVFSIRNTTVENYAEPVVHEIKVRRADLLADLRQPDKRASYLDLGQCWYVLGCDARGRPIAQEQEVPQECGVMFFEAGRLSVLRSAPRTPRSAIPFGIWMSLARATPVAGLDEGNQALLTPCDGSAAHG